MYIYIYNMCQYATDKRIASKKVIQIQDSLRFRHNESDNVTGKYQLYCKSFFGTCPGSLGSSYKLDSMPPSL